MPHEQLLSILKICETCSTLKADFVLPDFFLTWEEFKTHILHFVTLANFTMETEIQTELLCPAN